jgi:hypothetical protein
MVQSRFFGLGPARAGAGRKAARWLGVLVAAVGLNGCSQGGAGHRLPAESQVQGVRLCSHGDSGERTITAQGTLDITIEERRDGGAPVLQRGRMSELNWAALREVTDLLASESSELAPSVFRPHMVTYELELRSGTDWRTVATDSDEGVAARVLAVEYVLDRICEDTRFEDAEPAGK